MTTAERSLWLGQIRAMLGLELKKTFLRARALPVVLVALLPAVLLGVRALVFPLTHDDAASAADVARVYAHIFQIFYLRLVVFFGCFAIFTYLVRGETSERSLHFYLLAPLKREVFLAGKFVTGVVAAGALFSVSLALQLLLAFLPSATVQGGAYLFAGPGGGQALAYFGVVWLAVVGYGAVFLALALLFRNPMIPAAVLLGWEWINFFLPPVLQRISVIHYLQSLCPVPVDRGPFALPVTPTPAALAVPGLLVLSGLLLWVAARRARRLEVTYAGD
ncbi:MAG: hypothetical protein H6511_01425 [Holophagales bacterium]|nr:hypothetical protein [Holophagales bacterium]